MRAAGGTARTSTVSMREDRVLVLTESWKKWYEMNEV